MFIVAGSPIDDPQVGLHKFRRRGRQHGKDIDFGEDKARLERPRETEQKIAGQTKPAGLFHLPGIETGNAEQEKEAHGQLQGGDDRPCAGGD